MSLILVVDDDSLLLATLRVVLKRMGHQVITAEHGKKAVQLMNEALFLPDLLITDMVMPEMDGLEVIHFFRSNYSQIPILAISGEMPESFLHLAGRLGAQATLSKPLQPAVLGATIDRILGM